jgi:hypothetical protein
MGSGFKTFTAGAVLTASDVNNYLMEQSVMYFATTAARDAAISSPEDGMVVFVGSNDVNEGLYVYHGSAWNRGPGWNAPWGVMAYVQTTTSQGSITTRVAATSMTTGSVTYVANRLLRITVQTPKISSNAVSDRAEVFLLKGATTLASCTSQSSVVGVGITANLVIYDTTTAGASTYLLEIQRSSGTGTMSTNASATSPFQLIVEDIGPSGAPA